MKIERKNELKKLAKQSNSKVFFMRSVSKVKIESPWDITFYQDDEAGCVEAKAHLNALAVKMKRYKNC